VDHLQRRHQHAGGDPALLWAQQPFFLGKQASGWQQPWSEGAHAAGAILMQNLIGA
jgi:hypothetical protein